MALVKWYAHEHVLLCLVPEFLIAGREGVDIYGIEKYLNGVANVCRIHDLHVWPLSTTEVALTVHLVVTANSLNNDLLGELQQHLHDEFGIEHSTIQVEKESAEITCMLDRECT